LIVINSLLCLIFKVFVCVAASSITRGHGLPPCPLHLFHRQLQSGEGGKDNSLLPGEVLELVCAIDQSANSDAGPIGVDDPIFRHPDRTFGVLGITDRPLERPDWTLTLLRLGLKFLDLGERESSTTNNRF
jgi:hypothetical protein